MFATIGHKTRFAPGLVVHGPKLYFDLTSSADAGTTTSPPASSGPTASCAAADHIINTRTSPHSTAADREEQDATRLDRQITSRGRDQHNAIGSNQHRTAQRQTRIAAVEAARANLAHNRQIRV
jgi:hypothetical protein